MTHSRLIARVAAAVLVVPLLVTTGSAANAAPPRPGCGYGDDNHAHQAAPGQDPLNFRPGYGYGDDGRNHEHQMPPGQAGDSGADEGPMRGCKPDPRG